MHKQLCRIRQLVDGTTLLFINNAIFHYKGYLPHRLNIFNRIAIEGNNIGQFTLLNTAYFISNTNKISSRYCCRLNGFHSRHACFYHIHKLEPVLSMRKYTGIGTKRNL